MAYVEASCSTSQRSPASARLLGGPAYPFALKP
jgi:hypothetical protein